MNEDSYRALVSLEPKGAGRVFRTRNIRTAYENAVEAAKLDDVTFHTLRHTFASWAVMRGVSLRAPSLRRLAPRRTHQRGGSR